MFKLGALGVVRNASGQVLLVRTERYGWELPGGSVEDGEDLHTALRREVREESGCTLATVGPVSGLYFVLESRALITVFHATSSSPVPVSPIEDEDVREAAWFAPEDALERVTHVREHQRLEDALRGAPSAVYRNT